MPDDHAEIRPRFAADPFTARSALAGRRYLHPRALDAADQSFLALLHAYGVERVIDIRTIPRSRHNPQFNDTALASSLKARHLEYVHLKSLGGLRHPRKDSPNTGWRNQGFRGFADYMQTGEFRDALAVLIRMSCEKRVAIMCAEAVPWRCHRSLVADALSMRGVPAVEILSESSYRIISSPHSRGWRASRG